MSKVVLIVMDSVGVGELPDADAYGDAGSNTFLHVAEAMNPLRVPFLAAMGVGNMLALPGIPPADAPLGAFGRLAEVSKGKDTTTGHWEMMGVPIYTAFPTYPHGFPPELIAAYEAAIGRGVIGNTVASGTQIVEALGDEHVRTGKPIVYTSADSVFQVAAHEEVIPLAELYRICRVAREMLHGEHGVGRVIARPFTGPSGAYTRTPNRRDFSLTPIGRTVLDACLDAGVGVAGVGKIEDIFAQRGLSATAHTKGNADTLAEVLRRASTDEGLIFANCVDFDMLYGHRNDVVGYGRALEDLDSHLPAIARAMGDTGVLIVTADHGCDPTTESTDHSREYVPMLACGKPLRSGVDVGVRASFADLGATVAELLRVPWGGAGASFADEILASGG